MKTRPLPKNRRTSRTLSSHSLTRTAALGATAGAAFVIQPHLDAAIIYSGVQNVTAGFAGQFGIDGTAWNMDGLGGNDVGFLISNGTVSGKVLLNGGASASIIGGGGSVLNLALNAPIGAGGPWAGSGRIVQHVYGVPQGYFLNNLPGFAGIKFQNGADVHYGWIRLRWNDNADAGPEANFVTAIDWAYESTPETGILAGQIAPVPEPGTALTGLALLGVAALRRRRAA